MTPKISVLMSVYGESLEWLDMAVKSILNQSFKDFEFLIINDNPERKELEKYLDRIAEEDNRVKLIKNNENIGLTKSLNKGLRECQGKYVARMDADDISLPVRLSYQYKFLEDNPEYVVVGSDIKYFGPGSRFMFSDWIKRSNEEIKARMLVGSGFAHPAVMMRRRVLTDNSIEYDENYWFGQDYRLWEELMDKGKFFNLPDKLLHYRLSKKQNKRLTDGNVLNQRDWITWRIMSKSSDFKFLNKIDLKKLSYGEVLDVIKRLQLSKDKSGSKTLINYILLENGNVKLRSILNYSIFSCFLKFNLKNKLRFFLYKCKQKH